MKIVTIEELQRDVGGLIGDSQSEKVLVTQDGRPVALLIGVEELSDDDREVEESEEFWSMIEQRRIEPTRSFGEVTHELLDLEDLESAASGPTLPSPGGLASSNETKDINR